MSQHSKKKVSSKEKAKAKVTSKDPKETSKAKAKVIRASATEGKNGKTGSKTLNSNFNKGKSKGKGNFQTGRGKGLGQNLPQRQTLQSRIVNALNVETSGSEALQWDTTYTGDEESWNTSTTLHAKLIPGTSL